MEMDALLHKLGVSRPYSAEPFRNAEDGETYAVWKITASGNTYVLKQAKEYEAEVYAAFLEKEKPYAPRLLSCAEADGKHWLLMEYIEGEDLRYCTREKLRLALDGLIAMQSEWWEMPGFDNVAFSMEKARPGRVRRGEDLGNQRLKEAYGDYLRYWETLPRTLCHEDLLPFNVLVTENRAVLIDWEYAGMQPYLSSLARLIAHGEEKEDAFFYMKAEDRDFAIDYYYRNLAKEKGIPYADYRQALDSFLLYEYCEWIMLGIRYGDTQSERYERYLSLALNHISKR